MNGLIALRAFVLELGLTEKDLVKAMQRVGRESLATIVGVESASEELMSSLNLAGKRALKFRRGAGRPLELLVAFPLRRKGVDTFFLRLVPIEKLRNDRADHSMTVETVKPKALCDRVDPSYDEPGVHKPVDAVAVSRPLFAGYRDRSKPINK